MFAVWVMFRIKPGHDARFRALMQPNMAGTRAEPACLRFDMVESPGAPNEIFLYELFTNRAGFEAHLSTPHFKDFRIAVQPHIEAMSIREFPVVDSQG